jgi:hypothetical protein
MPSLLCVRCVPSLCRPRLSCLIVSVSCVTSLSRHHRHLPTIFGWLLCLSSLPLALAVSCVASRHLPSRVVLLPPCLTCHVIAISRVALCPLAVSPSIVDMLMIDYLGGAGRFSKSTQRNMHSNTCLCGRVCFWGRAT